MTEENIEETQFEETTSEETSEENTEETLLEGQQEGETVEEFVNRLKDEKTGLEEKNKQLYARAKKTEKKVVKSSNSNDLDLLEFFAQGGTKEDYQQLQVIMKGKDLTMTEAKDDVLYKSYLENKTKEEKVKGAQLKASGSSSNKKTVDTSDMTREEHEEYFNKIISQVG